MGRPSWKDGEGREGGELEVDEFWEVDGLSEPMEGSRENS